jgi:hypothetical protein
VTLQVAGEGGVIGSLVRVLDREGQVLAVRRVSGGDGRGGQTATQAHFALKPGTYRVEVHYSSGLKRGREIAVASAPLRGVIDDQTPRVE